MNFNQNPLVDSEFLLQLDKEKNKITYIKITSLTINELPIEQIEGQVLSGNISIDGNSAIRRTCSLTLITDKININDFSWGLKTKFKLEIGIENNINQNYPNIIYFPFGVFVITKFDCNISTNSNQISISGKDKMCLLNGEIGGNLPASVDFGTEEYYDLNNNLTYYNKIPIGTIIKEAVHTYANEPYYNIIINDLDEIAVELLEYRGNTPLYLLRDLNDDEFTNYTINGEHKCYYINDNGEEVESKLNGNDIFYDQRIKDLNVDIEKEPTKIYLDKDKKNYYTVAKAEYRQTAGYRITDLTYPGELVSSIGETLTSILDKITNMLADFEYFYDVNGRFIFQKKKTYVNTSFNNIVKTEDEEYVYSSAYTSSTVYNFENNNLITSFQNTPDLNNVKNDYSIWGNRKSISGVDIPIHYRYALDKKPYYYKTIEVTQKEADIYNLNHPDSKIKPQKSKEYTTKSYDWREIIYRMALDYRQYNQLEEFSSKLIQANKEEALYTTGYTGYEKYYIDLEGFWRQLYNPDGLYKKISDLGEQTYTQLYIKGLYTPINPLILENRNNCYSIVNNSLKPYLYTIDISDKNIYRYVSNDITLKREFILVDKSKYDDFRREDFFIKLSNEEKDKYSDDKKIIDNNLEYVRLIDYNNVKLLEKEYYYNNEENYYQISGIENKKIQQLYYNNGIINTNIYIYKYKTSTGEILTNIDDNLQEIKIIDKKNPITYYNVNNEYIQSGSNQYWSVDIANNPSNLNFWFDFLDNYGGELSQFSISSIGDRTKVVNDKDVTSIYFQEVPKLIFYNTDEEKRKIRNKTGYTPVRMDSQLENMFTISSQGKSAKDELDELLYNYAYCAESISLTTLPIYYLNPNTRILVRDEKNNINGEYIISRIGLQLSHKSTMSISATKAPERIY